MMIVAVFVGGPVLVALAFTCWVLRRELGAARLTLKALSDRSTDKP
jgi:hypothetical protein